MNSRRFLGLEMKAVAIMLLSSILGCIAETKSLTITAAEICVDSTTAFLDLRGGDAAGRPAVASAEEIVERYLAKDRAAANRNRFYVQGWRWHTLSLVRDARRLEKLALYQVSVEDVSAVDGRSNLEKAAKHVVDFNMAGLHRVENELFFPWIREKLCADDIKEDIRNAFREILDGIDEDRRLVAKLGQAVWDQAKVASSEVDAARRAEATSNVARMSAALNTRARDVLDREEKLLVPAVAAAVSEKEQKSFNNRVIRKLGILDSRLHLVGMHDAVWEGGDERERELFNEAIPALPRMMIPRWRRSLYEPQAGDLGSMH